MIADTDGRNVPNQPENVVIAAAQAPPKRKRGGGPRTEEGKRASRRNAMKDGMRSKVILPDELEAAWRELETAFFAEFQPNSWYEKRLVSRLAFTSVQLDRSAELTISDLRRVIDRAENYWDIDRRGEVDELGKRLKNDPERVARRLERSTQGADWLIERWEGLAEAVMTHGCWDERQRDLAFDLLGISKILRDGHVRVPAPDDRAGLERLAKGEIDRLWEQQRASLNRLDAQEQDLACCGLPTREDAETKRLRKYESDIKREWFWTNTQLFKLRENRPLAADPSASNRARPVPPPSPRSFLDAMPGVSTTSPDEPPLPIAARAVMDADGLIWSSPEAEAAALAELESIDEDAEGDASVASVTPSPVTGSVSVSAPAAAVSRSTVPTFKPGGNRRQRRAKQKQIRQAERRAVSKTPAH